MTTSLILLGAGNIGRALLSELGGARFTGRGTPSSPSRTLRVSAVVDRSGYLLAPEGLSAEQRAAVLATKANGAPIASLPGATRVDASVTRDARELVDDIDAAFEANVEARCTRRVLVDLTASDTTELLVRALRRGWDVVLANKLPLAGPQESFDRLQRAARNGGGRLLHEATVGAGLPVIDTVRKLLDSGDTVHAIEGCPSGTLGFLFGELGTGAPFSEVLSRAITAGLTEPDPRIDLSGIDVARKALILARLIGYRGEPDTVRVESLVPEALASLALDEFLARAGALDAVWAERVATARAHGQVLRYRARVTPTSVTVGLVAVDTADRLGTLHGTDNQFAFTTDRYDAQPIVISGPGAGPLVTASGVIGDLLDVASHHASDRSTRQPVPADGRSTLVDGVAHYDPRRPSTAPTYEITGPHGAPLVVALGGISASHHVVATATDPSPGWWDAVVGPGRALDTRHYRVLGVDFIDGGRASTGRPARAVTTHDQADLIASVLDTLGEARVHAIVGASYGGMVALAFAERYPERVERLVVISAAHESHPMSTGLRAMQRRIVELGLETGRPVDALALARGVAMTTYRTAREFGERFHHSAHRDAGVPFEVERYLEQCGRRFAGTFPPERFIALSLSADLHRVDPRRIRTPATYVAAEGDTLVPESSTRELAARSAGPSTFVQIPTPYGHDAFLTEPEKIGRILATALSSAASHPSTPTQGLARMFA